MAVNAVAAVILMAITSSLVSAVTLPVNSFEHPEVATSIGTFSGIRATTSTGRPLYQFLGVPYARPPLGALRFMPTEPLENVSSDDSVIHADHFRPSCMQPPHLGRVTYRPLHVQLDQQQVSEDCLYLNIYVPERADPTNASLSVMVWIPGEGFDFGNANQYDASRLATHGNVIVVTVNYRVNLFGFLSTGDSGAPGNVGLMDQLMAVRFLKANVANFGGNPDKITLFGRLTGSISISALMTSPAVVTGSQPLFRRAILQSGVAHGRWIFESDPLSQARTLAKKVGCAWEADATSAELLACLRALPADVLVRSVFAVQRPWRLVAGTDFLPVAGPLVGNGNGHIDVMIGTNQHEGSLCLLTHMVQQTQYMAKMMDDQLTGKDVQDMVQTHVDDYYGVAGRDAALTEAIRQQYAVLQGKNEAHREQFIDFCGDLYSKSSADTLATRLTADGGKVFRYEFTHRPSFSLFPEFVGAAQGDEVLFVFGLVDQAGLEGATKDEIKLSNQMMTAWSNFAKIGNPNPIQKDLDWPTFGINKQYLEINTLMSAESVQSSSGNKRLAFWANINKSVL